MKNPNELRKYILFQLYECDAIKEYLEEMALKGWKLKYIRTFFYFEKIEPQTLYYSVEVFSKASAYDTIPTKDTNEYIDYCRQAGWEFVCNLGQIIIFISDSDNMLPIETDEPLKLRTINRGVIKQNAISWFIAFPLLAFNLFLQFIDFDYFITNNLSLMYVFFYLIFILALVIQIISFFIWIVKQRSRLKQGKAIQYISKNSRRKQTSLQLIPLGIMALVSLIVAAHSLIDKDYFTALLVCFIMMLIPILFLFSHFLQKQGLSRTANKIIPVFLGIGISFSFMIFVAMLIFLPEVKTPTDASSLSSKTFLASSTTYYYNLEDGSEIAVTVFKSNYSLIINQYLYSETHHYFKKDYEEIELPEWNAKSIQDSRGKFYIEYDKCVISFLSESELNQAQIDHIKTFMNK